MNETNRIEKSFGPTGSFAGLIVFIGGLILITYSFSGVILIIIGALFGFSYSSTTLDYDRRRMKFSNNIFGLIKTGHWIEVNETMKVGVQHSNTTWRSFSQGNRVNDLEQKTIMMFLFGPDNQKVIPVKSIKKRESIDSEIETMCLKFGFKRM